jgi:hypothetical protein
MTATSSIGSTGSHPGVSALSPGLVTLLQTLQGYPAVSLLMSTTPAARMLREDAARLAALARQAQARLESEAMPGARATVLTPLAELVSAAGRGPATAAVGVFVSAAISTVVHLPVPVNDRVVIDPTFATRDLVRALHRTPRHVVLALSLNEARLFDGLGEDLRPAPVRSFPRKAPRTASAPGPGQTQQVGGGRQRNVQPQQRRSFFQEVDRALGAYLRLHPAPLVLVGTERVLTEFRRLSDNLTRLAGCVHGSLLTAPTADLVARIRPVLNDYLHSRQQEALDLLDRRSSAKRAVSGIESAWLAARAERPEMLAVEEGYFYPARLDAAGDLLAPAPDVDHPEVIDDAVDEKNETVLRRGGWVALVDDGLLAGHDRVALTLRR